jgi:hypothetical protein
MSMRTAMKPRGTTVLIEESGLSVHDIEIECMYAIELARCVS